MTDIKEQRAAIRKEKVVARNTLSEEERADKSRAIVERLAASPEYQSARVIMIYRWTKGEVKLDLLEQINEAGGSGKKTLLYPLCVTDSEMIALLPEGDNSWIEGYKGIFEPVREKSKEFKPETIDLVVCPCSSFDEAGGRMGMGRGFYDRFIEKCVNAKIVAVAFECQKSESVLAQAWDKPMQAVFTEEKEYRF